MTDKKRTDKSKGAKSLSADKASQVKGGASFGLNIPPDPIRSAGDGSVKLIPGIKAIEVKY